MAEAERTVLTLSHNEQLALVALVKQLVLSDGRVSDDEETEALRLVAELGGSQAYQDLLAEADRRFVDEESLKAFLGTITDRDACQFIGMKALEVGQIGAVEPDEGRLLDWLVRSWGLDLGSLEPPDEPAAG